MQTLKTVWLHLKTLWLVLRVILFERLETAFLLVWAFVIAITAVACLWSDIPVVTVIVAGIVLYWPLSRLARAKRHWLIRRGDRVEYSVPSDDDVIQRFETACILRPMEREYVAQTASFDVELLELYRHFYLVDTGKTNRIIPYEWIVAIDTGSLEF